MKKQLDDHLAENYNGKVKVVHAKKREGLIRTRLLGAKHATGEVLIFLDSHVEANINWLPPLLGNVHVIGAVTFLGYVHAELVGVSNAVEYSFLACYALSFRSIVNECNLHIAIAIAEWKRTLKRVDHVKWPFTFITRLQEDTI